MQSVHNMDAKSFSNLLSKEIDSILVRQPLNFREHEHIKNVTQLNIVKFFNSESPAVIGKMFLEHLRVKWPGHTFEYKGCVEFKKENENDFDISFDTADQNIVFHFRFSFIREFRESSDTRYDDVPAYKIYWTIILKTTALRIPDEMEGLSTAQPSSFSSMFSWCCW